MSFTDIIIVIVLVAIAIVAVIFRRILIALLIEAAIALAFYLVLLFSIGLIFGIRLPTNIAGIGAIVTVIIFIGYHLIFGGSQNNPGGTYPQ